MSRAPSCGCDFVDCRCVGRCPLESVLSTARELGMAALIEVHDQAELDRALRLSRV